MSKKAPAPIDIPLNAFKEQLLTDTGNSLNSFPKMLDKRDQNYRALLLQTVDKTIIWFMEHYDAKKK